MTPDERLELLATRLENFADLKGGRGFNLLEWFLNDGDDTLERGRIITWSCGAAACAVGHACLIPEFNAEGFGYETVAGRMGPTYSVPGHTSPGGVLVPEEEWTQWGAVDRFFSLGAGESRTLFSYMAYSESDWTNPAAVARRIRAFVAARKSSG